MCLWWSGMILGFLLGQAAATEESGAYVLGTWNPFYVFKQLSDLQHSPWAMLSDDMAGAIRESKKELMGMGLVSVLTGAAFYKNGMQGALQMYEYSTDRMRAAKEGGARAGQALPAQGGEPEWIDSLGPKRVPRGWRSAPRIMYSTVMGAHQAHTSTGDGTPLVLSTC